MREKAVRIGKPVPLIGVMSEPSELDPTKPAILLLNSGVMHHVGACRTSTRVARGIADAGFLALRFDYSGIGDSEPRRGTASFEESAVAETREVMDYVQRTRGIDRFALFGLCSGADASYFAALADERVVATIQIDAFCYHTWKFHFHKWWPKLFRWRNFLRRKSRELTERNSDTRVQVDKEFLESPTYTRVFPPREEVAAGLCKLTERQIHMYVMFTGSERDYSYEAQYRESFSDVDFGGRLKVDYLVDSNHIMVQPGVQARLVRDVVDWMTHTSRLLTRSG